MAFGLPEKPMDTSVLPDNGKHQRLVNELFLLALLQSYILLLAYS